MIKREDISKALAVMRKGGVILYPTDTIWGIGCDASNETAVRKIFSIKKRRDSKSMLVLLDDPGKLHKYINIVPEIALELIKVSNKPLTIIYPEGKNIAPLLSADDGSIGIRITSDPFCKELINKLGNPLVSTSANISGFPSPSVFSEISGEIKALVDYIVEWRQNDQKTHTQSSLIKLEAGGTFKILRD